MSQFQNLGQRLSSYYQERRSLLVLSMVIMVVISLPYFRGYAEQGDDWRFTGFVFGVEDGNSYIGKMLRGAQGDWLFRTPYTAVEQRGVFTFFHYLILGKLTSPGGQHEQMVALYHIFRFVGGILAIFATYDFSALFLKKYQTRMWSIILITLGNGLGWVLVIAGRQNWLGSLPLDFFSPESFGFLGTFGIAHLPWARAFFLWGIRGYLLQGNQEKNDAQTTSCLENLAPGLLWLLTGIAQPITGMIIGVVVGFHLLGIFIWQLNNQRLKKQVNWRIFKIYVKLATRAGFIALPLVLYNFFIFNWDPFVKIWVAQSRIPPPNALHYLVAYGLILPFAVSGIIWFLRRPSIYSPILVVWVLLFPLLLAIPFSLNRRLVEGLWVVLVLLSLVGYERLQNLKWKWIYLIFVFTIPTTIFLWGGGLIFASNPGTPVFRPSDEISAFEFLSVNASDTSVVLTAYETGNALPAWAPVFVVIGHGPESAGISTNHPRVQAFYSLETSDADRFELLREFKVDYVFWGPAEKALGNWDLSSSNFLESEFKKGEYEIYSVK